MIKSSIGLLVFILSLSTFGGHLQETLNGCKTFDPLKDRPLRREMSHRFSRECVIAPKGSSDAFLKMISAVEYDHQVVCGCNILPGLVKRNLEVKSIRESAILLAREFVVLNRDKKLTADRKRILLEEINLLTKKLCPKKFGAKLASANYDGKPVTLEDKIEDLLLRADVFPISIALTLSGVESSYCTSNWAHKDKNPFGVGCPGGCKFKSWDEASAYLIDNTNCEPTAYKNFKETRQSQRNLHRGEVFNESALDGRALLRSLGDFNVEKRDYFKIAEDKHMVKNNYLQFDAWWEEFLHERNRSR